MAANQPGQTAYEAFHSASPDALWIAWEHVSQRDRRPWATAERACMNLEELPPGEHETEAARLAGLVAVPDATLPTETVAQLATAHAVLGLCDLIRAAVANA